jgi:hypothetical protein
MPERLEDWEEHEDTSASEGGIDENGEQRGGSSGDEDIEIDEDIDENSSEMA